MRLRKQYLLVVVFLLVLTPSVFALSFTSGPSIVPSNNVTTSDSFFCRFTPSDGALTANVTWYRNGVAWSSDDQNTSVTNDVQFQSSPVDTDNTAKGQTWRCQVTLNNATGSIASNSSQITLVNALPIIVTIANQTVYEDAAFSLQMNATDPDNDSFVWISVDQDASDFGGVSLFSISAGGLISFTETDEDLVGNHSMLLLVNDLTDIAGLEVNFELIAVNDAPVLTPASLTAQCFQGSVCNIQVAATDEEDDDLNFTANETFVNMNLSGYISFTPNASQVGNLSILVNVTDGQDWTVGELNITVNETNTPPYFTYNSTAISSGVQNQTSNFTFFVNATDIDSDQTISFSINSTCGVANPWSITRLANGSNSSQAQATINVNFSNSNDYVACREVVITISDGINSTSANFSLNITNSNDAPLIYNISYYAENEITPQFSNTDMKNVTVAKGLAFAFRVNASDPDALTYEGENLSYSLSGHNPLLFQINTTSGLISSVAATMNDSYVGNTSFLVVVTDDEGLSYNTSINITVINNTQPVIIFTNNSNCAEEAVCSKDFVAYDDEGDNLSFSINISFVSSLNVSTNYSNMSAYYLFNISFTSFNGSHTTYTSEFTPDDNMTGNYSVTVTFMDNFGDYDVTTFNFSISQVNDVPYFGNNDTALSVDNITFSTISENVLFTKTLYAIDPDVVFSNDTLSANYSYISSSVQTSLTAINASAWLLSISPNSSDAGNYSINLTLIDSLGNYSSKIVNFTVYDSTQAPNITQIRPYLNASNQTVFSFTASLDPSGISNISVNESVATIFDIVATDEDDTDMLATWYEDGEVVASNLDVSGDASYSRTFDYNESGVVNITVVVSDKGIDMYTWLVTIVNVNQAPVFTNPLQNLTATESAAINGIQVFADFFRLGSPDNIVFLDPDDDVNGNGYIDNSENNTLSFYFNTSSSCDDYASFSFSGSKLTITPESLGNCTAVFYTNDTYGAHAVSNTIRIDILDLGESESSSSSSSSSGSSSTRTVTRTVTVPVDNDVPSSVKFVYPGISSLYSDGTVVIPVTIVNNWEVAITDILLSENASISELVGSFSESVIDGLAVGESYVVNLTYENYRFEAPFEINISANIGSLDHTDTATVFINALEKGSYSEDAVKTRVGFARDLLNDNSECQELNEVLNNAENEVDPDLSLKLINSVIDGCKYLINTRKEPANEIPQSFVGKIGIYTENYVDYRLLFTLILGMTVLAIAVGLFSRFKLKKI